MNPQNEVFNNKDLKRIIFKFLIPKRCKNCNDKINNNISICVSCIWHLNNPNNMLWN